MIKIYEVECGRELNYQIATFPLARDIHMGFLLMSSD
jgi:hypothetical protein